MKTEVYSWRVSPELKSSLEREARRRKLSLSAVLDLAAEDWLRKNRPAESDAEEQKRLHEAAMKFVGTITGNDSARSDNVRTMVRQRLRQRRAH